MLDLGRIPNLVEYLHVPIVVYCHHQMSTPPLGHLGMLCGVRHMRETQLWVLDIPAMDVQP